MKKREDEDRKNFAKFQEEIALNSTPQDLKSPFLRAIMRTHTKEVESFKKLATEIEITKRTSRDVKGTYEKSNIAYEARDERDKSFYRELSKALSNGFQKINDDVSQFQKSAHETLDRFKRKIEENQKNVNKISNSDKNTSFKISEYSEEQQKTSKLISSLSYAINHVDTGLAALKAKTASMTKERSDLLHVLLEKESILMNMKKEINRSVEKEKEKIRLVERMRMGLEDWHSLAYNVTISGEHTASYTRFLEEQILLAHKRFNGLNVVGNRIGSSHSLRASLHTPLNSERGDSVANATWTVNDVKNGEFISLDSLQWSPKGINEEQLNHDHIIDEPITIEDKLLNLVNDLEERMKMMEHVKLLSDEEKYHKLSEEIELRRLAQKKIEEEKNLWSVISQHLNNRKEECQRAHDIVENNLTRARYDIKELHGSRVAKTKQISNWEVKFLQDHGKHPSPQETESHMGYVYEMIDKIQYDLREKMSSVLDLSIKFKILKQELEELATPVEIASSRSTRGMSPIPREFDGKFYLTDDSGFESYKKNLDDIMKKNNATTGGFDDMEDFGKGIFIDFDLRNLEPKAEESALSNEAVRFTPDTPNGRTSGRAGNEESIQKLNAELDQTGQTPVHKTTSGGVDTGVNGINWSKVHTKLLDSRIKLEEPLHTLKSNLRLMKDEINTISKRRIEIKEELSSSKSSDSDVASRLTSELNDAEATLKLKIEEVSNTSSKINHSKDELISLQDHIEIAKARSERGMSPENRPFDRKYLNDLHDNNQLQSIAANEPKPFVSVGPSLDPIDEGGEEKSAVIHTEKNNTPKGRKSEAVTTTPKSPTPSFIKSPKLSLRSPSSASIKSPTSSAVQKVAPTKSPRKSTIEQIDYGKREDTLSSLEAAKVAAKKKIKSWRKSFMDKNGREPTLEEKKTLAKDIFIEYAQIDMSIKKLSGDNTVDEVVGDENFEVNVDSPRGEKSSEPKVQGQEDTAVSKAKQVISAERKVPEQKDAKKEGVQKQTEQVEQGERIEENKSSSEEKIESSSTKLSEGLDTIAPTRLEVELNDAVRKMDELIATRAAAKKKVKVWTKNFQSAYGRDPTIDEKREHGNDIFVAFASVDNELNVQKKIVKNKQIEFETFLNEDFHLKKDLKEREKEFDECNSHITLLENLKLSAKVDVENWNNEFRKLNNREPTAKEKREHSIELYNAFTKSELELQNERSKLRDISKTIETIRSKLSQLGGTDVDAKNSPSDDEKNAAKDPLESTKLLTTGKTSPTSPTSPAGATASPKKQSPRSERVNPLESKLRITRETIKEEKALVAELKTFLISSDDELRELKSQRAAAKISIKRWIEVFKSTVGRMPTVDDQRSSLERNLFDQYQKLDNAISALRSRQENSHKQIADSENSINRMIEIEKQLQSQEQA